MRTTHRPATVAALMLSMAMAAMEATVVGTVMPTVISELGGLALYGWVGSSYLLASTVSVPVFGKLADLYGRKPIQMFGIVLFLLGSVGSGLSTSIVQLIAARAVQGLGAGAMQPVALTIVGDIFTMEERGRIQGLFGAVWGIAGISGPLLGGAIVHFLSWRWVFLVNVPFGIASMALLAWAYRERPDRKERVRIDGLGAIVLAGGTIALLLGAGGEHSRVLLPVGLACVLLFIFVERRAAEPLLPLSLVTRRPVAVAAISNSLTGAAMMGSVIFIPLFVQGVLGRGPTEAGATIAPMLVGWPIAATIVGRRLARTGFRGPVIVGGSLVSIALVVFAALIATRPVVPALQATMFLFGVGMGVTNTAIVVALQTGVGHEQRGVVTALSMFSRSMGGTLGVGGLGALLAVRLSARLSPDTVAGLLDPHRRRAAGALAPLVARALDEAMRPLFYTLTTLAVINLGVVLLYPRAPASAATPAAESRGSTAESAS